MIPFDTPDDPEAWRQDALCAQTDPDIFTLDKGGSTVAAKKICAECEVRVQCLEYALTTGQESSIWGGLSPQERRRLLRGRAA